MPLSVSFQRARTMSHIPPLSARLMTRTFSPRCQLTGWSTRLGRTCLNRSAPRNATDAVVFRLNIPAKQQVVWMEGFNLTRTTLMTRQTSLAVPGGRAAKHRISVLVCFHSLSKWTASVGYPDPLCRTDAPRRIGTRRGRGAVAAPGEEAGGLMRSAAADRWLASLRDLCWVAAFSPLLVRHFVRYLWPLIGLDTRLTPV